MTERRIQAIIRAFQQWIEAKQIQQPVRRVHLFAFIHDNMQAFEITADSLLTACAAIWNERKQV